MKLVYVAGPYRAESEWAVLNNIRNAERVALKVWKSGCACICPHKNTSFFGGAAEDEVWLRGDLEIVGRCDAVVCADGWECSVGSLGEIEFAKKNEIPVFENFERFAEWLRSAD